MWALGVGLNWSQAEEGGVGVCVWLGADAARRCGWVSWQQKHCDAGAFDPSSVCSAGSSLLVGCCAVLKTSLRWFNWLCLAAAALQSCLHSTV